MWSWCYLEAHLHNIINHLQRPGTPIQKTTRDLNQTSVTTERSIVTAARKLVSQMQIARFAEYKHDFSKSNMTLD